RKWDRNGCATLARTFSVYTDTPSPSETTAGTPGAVRGATFATPHVGALRGAMIIVKSLYISARYRLLFAQFHTGLNAARLGLRPLLERPRHRSRDGEYADVRPRKRDRLQRTVGGGGPAHGQRHQEGAGRRQGGQGDAGPHAREHRGGAPDEGRRDRRLRSDRGHAAVLHPEGPQPPDPGQTAHHHR